MSAQNMLQLGVEPEKEAHRERPPRFVLRTFGCQMNVHDGTKIENLLLHAGWEAGDEIDDADLVIVNTCSVREKAEHRLYTDLGILRAWKAARPARVIGVGGCVAQQAGDALLARFPQLDFVFGTHNLRFVASLAEAAREGVRAARTEETRSVERFDLPERHSALRSATPGRAFVTVMEGCDMFCAFCIVPRTRGREISRPAAAIVAEARGLAARGVREITLLGQTVNAYGRHDRQRERSAAAQTLPFAALIARIAAIPGIARIRYTSPHPLFFDDALIRAHGEIEALCPHVHLPVQSGSDAVLARMRRRYRRDEYLGIVDRLRASRPEIDLTTDLIVGFPGETDADFEQTLELVRRADFVDAFSFKYSARPGTAAAEAGDLVPESVKQERLERLQDLLRGQTLAAHRRRVGETVELLIEGPSRHGGRQLSARDPRHRLVNLDPPPGAPVEPGILLEAEIVDALPRCLIGRAAGSAPTSETSL